MLTIEGFLKNAALKVACVKIAEGIDNLKQLGFTNEQIMEATRRQVYELKDEPHIDVRV